MSVAGLKLGLMGGTFDPVHLGHLRAAEEICELMGLDRMIFVPAANPPHKRKGPAASFPHRLAMCRLATADHPGFMVSDVEGHRDGPSYTVETLRHFHDKFGPDTEIFFITGLDAFMDIHKWKDHKELFKLASFVVTTRPGTDSQGLAPLLEDMILPGACWDEVSSSYRRSDVKPVFFRPVSSLDISSTDIRNRVSSGESVRYLVSEKVREYISDNGLYKVAH